LLRVRVPAFGCKRNAAQDFGVRGTLCDDVLFLPIAAAEYMAFTGDTALLHTRIPYAPPVSGSHGFAYGEYRGTLGEHVLRAIEHACRRSADGLYKIETENGSASDVFGSQILYRAICKFLPYITDLKKRIRLMDTADRLKRGVRSAFSVDRFARAYAGGTAFGTLTAREGKIDLLPQAWAAISGIGTDEQCRLALTVCTEQLFDVENGLLKRLAPPFVTDRSAGSLCDEPPGTRENGGQDTLAAVWFVRALLKIGETERAWRYFNGLSPLQFCRTREKAAGYGIEPYKIARFIRTGEYAGRAESDETAPMAALYYHTLVDGFLGVKLSGTKLALSPRLPSGVPSLHFTLHSRGRDYRITVDNTRKKGSWRYLIGAVRFNGNDLELTDRLAEKHITVFRDDG
jgi:cyclic beta-1,2-glucan synthetase